MCIYEIWRFQIPVTTLLSVTFNSLSNDQKLDWSVCKLSCVRSWLGLTWKWIKRVHEKQDCCVHNLISCFSKDVSKILRMMRFWDPCRIFSMLLTVACSESFSMLPFSSTFKDENEEEDYSKRWLREREKTTTHFFEGVRVTRQQESLVN